MMVIVYPLQAAVCAVLYSNFIAVYRMKNRSQVKQDKHGNSLSTASSGLCCSIQQFYSCLQNEKHITSNAR